MKVSALRGETERDIGPFICPEKAVGGTAEVMEVVLVLLGDMADGWLGRHSGESSKRSYKSE
jgi:hypothetical protein